MANIFNVFKVFSRFQAIKNSDKRSTSKKYGIYSIICALFIVAFSAVLAIGFNIIDTHVVFGFILILIGICAVAAFFVGSVLFCFFQLNLNRKPIGFVALGIIVACVAVGIILFMTI